LKLFGLRLDFSALASNQNIIPASPLPALLRKALQAGKQIVKVLFSAEMLTYKFYKPTSPHFFKISYFRNI